MVSFITAQYELFVVVVSFMYYSAIRTLSGSITVRELFQVVSLVTVSCVVICSGSVSCDGTIHEDEYGARLMGE